MKQEANIIKIFNVMWDHIFNQIYKSTPAQMAELIVDFEQGKVAIENSDWENEIKQNKGDYLEEKSALINKTHKLQLLINKVQNMKAFL